MAVSPTNEFRRRRAKPPKTPKRPRKGGGSRRPAAVWLIHHPSSQEREETPMSHKSLVAPLLVGAVALFLTGTASAGRFPIQPPARRPVYAPAPVCPPVGPGQLPDLEPAPTRHTLTIYNGVHVQQQNFVQTNGAWRSCGEFRD